MLSINTNLSNLIAQNSLTQSTNKLNQAIERMSTGYKINHASDNAANYSISTNMTTKIGAYQVAQSNTEMGMDLVTTASDIISLMQDKATRLHALSTQARNGTYGSQSLNAINSEASAIMAEINRLYSTAQYNGVSLFTGGNEEAEATPEVTTFAMRRTAEPEMATFAMTRAATTESYFIENPVTYTDEEVAAMKTMTDLVNGVTSATNEYSISTKEELVALANYVNSDNDTTGMTFVLGADIDLSSISNWTPIGDYATDSSLEFKGTFDGNGHVIKNLKIDRSAIYQGLFGCTGYTSQIKNVGLEGGSVKGKDYVGGLAGDGYTISNCYAAVNVTGTGSYIGGLVGKSNSTSITNSYATGEVSGYSYVGGLAGLSMTSISNCYATGNVTGTDSRIGGLVGDSSAKDITNSYATGAVTGGAYYTGGLVGYAGRITNSYATGEVDGNSTVGGLAGQVRMSISNCYATGNVNGTSAVGGLVGTANQTTSNCYAIGIVTGTVGSNSVTNSTDWDGTFFTYDYGVADHPGNEGGLTPDPDPTPNPDTGGTGSGNTGGIGGELYGVDSFLLQVGVNSDSSCQIGFDINFSYDLSEVGADITSDFALSQITDFINLLSEKQTQFGAIQNRLESTLDSISVSIENLTSSLSTIRDADIAELSSTYIKQQILQQASATLLATANQSPSIALQLI